MKSFTFAEVNLAKKCYRVIRVIAEDEQSARDAIPGGDWAWGMLGEKPSSGRPGHKFSLLRTREEWKSLCRSFGITADDGDSRIAEATEKIPTGKSAFGKFAEG